LYDIRAISTLSEALEHLQSRQAHIIQLENDIYQLYMRTQISERAEVAALAARDCAQYNMRYSDRMLRNAEIRFRAVTAAAVPQAAQPTRKRARASQPSPPAPSAQPQQAEATIAELRAEAQTLHQAVVDAGVQARDLRINLDIATMQNELLTAEVEQLRAQLAALQPPTQ
jgi:chromosome segregation ATPase